MKSYSPLLLVIVSIGIFFFFIDPQYKEVKTLRQTQNENEEMIQKAAKLRADREVLNTKYTSFSAEEKEQLAKIIPETVDNVRLILDIDNIAQEYGIVLRGITITGGTEDSDTNKSKQVVDKTSGKHGTITLGFSFTASYETFQKFMIDLEDSMRIVDITDFSVTANEQTDVYDYSLKLNTYWLR